MKKYTVWSLLIVSIALFSLVACEPPTSSKTNQALTQKDDPMIWGRLTKRFTMEHPFEQPTVRHYINRYSKQKHYLNALSRFANPYLYHVLEEVEKRKLPGELALLPMIESEYRPHATSHVGATGIWQIGNITARHYKLKKDHWFDGRKDIAMSTEMALDYLKYLHKEFNQDWYLALAAYNAGPGRVRQAIRANKRAGRPTDYWSLPLPKQTKHFVPKLLALCYMVNNPDKFGLELEQIPNKPYFVHVSNDQQIDLHLAAELASMNITDLKKMNAGYLQHATHPQGPHHLILPADNAKSFKTNLAKHKQSNKGLMRTRHHTIQKGDNLGKIAKQYNVSVQSIKQANQLKNDIIVQGRRLVIPLSSASVARAKAGASAPKS